MAWTNPATGLTEKTTVDYVHPNYRDRVDAIMSGSDRDPVANAHLHLARVNQLKDMAANHQITKAVASTNVRSNLEAAARERRRAAKK